MGQLEAVEEAQNRLQKDRCKTESLALTDDTVADPDSCTSNATSGPGQQQYERESLEKRLSRQLRQAEADVQKLSTQVQQLLKESTMNTRRRPANSRDNTGQKRTDGPVCWGCGKNCHVKRDCPQRRTAFKNHLPSESAAVSASLFIYGFLEGHRTKMLVDTGSAVTIIRRDIWDGISRKQLETPVRAVLAANGNEISLSGQGDVLVQVGDLSVRHNVLVADCLTQDCILGSDFLLLHGCVIDLHNHSLLVKGKVVPLSSGIYHSPISTCGVAVAETVEVPAHSQFRLIANRQGKKKEQGVDDLGSVMFEPSHDFMESHGLAVAHAVVGEDNEDIVVQILNPTPYSVQVQQGSRIGCLRPLLDVCAIELEAVARQGDNRSHARECIIHQLVSCAQGVTQKERQQLTDLLTEFESILSDREDDLGRTHLVYHKIDTGDAVPIRQSARRLPYFQRVEVRKTIEDMLKRGIIEPSSSAWSSPVVLVKKKDGSTRFCIDFRKVNAVTTRDAQPLPRIDDTLDLLGGASYFSTLDLASGYWQVEVDPLDREKTAFITPFGLHQFRVMPFGLSNAPATFQRLMEQVLAGLHWSTCLVYLDDIIVFSRTVADHLDQLRDVFTSLKNAGLTLKPSKCHLLQMEVRYLGHVVSGKGIQTDPEKVRSVFDWPIPLNQKDLKCFLGLASYYRRFVQGFAQVAAPLNALTNKGKEWMWTADCTHAFLELKKRLVSTPVLVMPQFTQEFILDTDASGEGLGAVLSQVIEGHYGFMQRDQLMLKEGVLYRQWKNVPGGGLHKRLQLVLPASLVPGVLSGLHDTPVRGHLGVKKTLEKVQMRFYWPSQKKDVEKWCASCAKCSSRKSPLPPRAPLQLEDSVSRPLERIAMDIVGPLPVTERGNRYILVVGDYFTRWKEEYPMKDMEAQTVACILVNEFICHLGVPDTIHTDQGRNFESKLIKELCQMLGIKKTRTTPYHPQSDGMVERFNRTLLNMLSIAVGEDEMSWDLQLPLLLLAYRTSVHDTTGTSPFELMYGREVRLPEDIMFALPATVETARADYKGTLKRRLQHAYQLVRKHTRRQQEHQNMENEHQPTITSDKLEDIVLYFPQPQENPLVPGGDNRVEGEDENGQEIQAPGLLPPQDVVDQDLDVHDEPAPELPALRRSTRIRHPPGWYGDRIVLPDTLA
ncbi:hypothetical protein EMCRGX_G000127 [Ephydatia muelleri]